MFLEKLFKHSVIFGFLICEKKVLAGPDTWGCRCRREAQGSTAQWCLRLVHHQRSGNAHRLQHQLFSKQIRDFVVCFFLRLQVAHYGCPL